MSDYTTDIIDKFMLVTGADEHTSERFLAKAHGNITVAVGAYINTQNHIKGQTVAFKPLYQTGSRSFPVTKPADFLRMQQEKEEKQKQQQLSESAAVITPTTTITTTATATTKSEQPATSAAPAATTSAVVSKPTPTPALEEKHEEQAAVSAAAATTTAAASTAAAATTEATPEATSSSTTDVPAATTVQKAKPAKQRKLIICGPPGSGKGTQADMISEHFGLVHLSSGELLREEVAKGTPMGLAAKDFMDRGVLVPGDIANKVLMDRIAQEDCQTIGWIFDGYPTWDYLEENNMIPDRILFLDISDDACMQRLCGRVKDPLTGKVYHLTFCPPEDPEVLARLTKRSTDNETKSRVRLQVYHRQMDYAARSFPNRICVRVDADQGIQEVFADITTALYVSGFAMN